MKRLLYLILLLLCSCNFNEIEITPSDSDSPSPNAFISDLKLLSSESAQILMQTYIFRGVVVTEDDGGNFYRSMIIDDGSGALEIMLGIYAVDNAYPLGCEVTVVAEKGLYIMDNEGVTQLGLEGGSSIGYFSHKYIIDQYVYRGDMTATPAPLESYDLSNCGQIVKISNVSYSGDYLSWASYNSWTGYYSDSYREFSSVDGNSINVFTSGYACFAGESLPTGEVDICGILYYNDSVGYYIRLRDESDVTLHY